jgi:hypothetical protein
MLINELRKDELIKIGQLLRREYISTNQTTWVGIIDKIQAMIDNCCDHSWNFEHASGYVVCDKCNGGYGE